MAVVAHFLILVVVVVVLDSEKADALKRRRNYGKHVGEDEDDNHRRLW